MLFEKISLLNEQGQVEHDRFVTIEGNKIVSLSDKAPEHFSGERYDGRNKLLMPAFANSHCHVAMTLMRGYGEGVPLQRWLEEYVFPFEATLTDEEIYWGSLLGMAEMISSGCVSFTDMYIMEPGIINALRTSGMKANLSFGTYSGGHDPSFRDTEGYAQTEGMLEEIRKNNNDSLIADVSLHSEYATNENTVRTTIAYAREHDLRMHVHLSETRKEHEECKKRRGGRTPLAYFRDCGLLELPCTFAHGIWLEDSDYEILARAIRDGADLTLVHNPSSNLKLASGFAPLDRWRETGVNIAIGTDGAASNNNLNMWEEITLASLLQKGVQKDPSALSPVETFRMATGNGFISQGRTDSGVIRENARADLIVIDLNRPHLTPVFDLMSNMLHSAQASDVILTISDGKVLYRDGKWTGFDILQVIDEVRQIAEQKKRILQR